MLAAALIAYLAAERPFSFSLVDRECKDAQQQYYDARNGAGANKNKYPSEQEQSRSDAHDHADVCAQNRMAEAAEAGFWLLLASLVAALGAAVAAWWTVSIMRDSARREMRAYVGMYSGGMQLVVLTEGGRGIRVTVDLKNAGRTPGYNFTTWIKRPRILEEAEVSFDGPTPLAERTAASIIAPDTMAHIHWTIGVTDDELGDLRAGTKRVFVWGGADYKDAFGDNRHFIFRCWNDRATNLNNPGDGVPLSPHRVGYEGN